MKYLVINNESTTKEQYWSYCEKEHNPFIIVKIKELVIWKYHMM